MMPTNDTSEEPSGCTKALDGIRVLDFSRFIAGPSCAAFLGDLGAEVIRIERPDGGEDRWIGPLAENSEGSLFLQNNRNKRSLTLKLGADESTEIIERLVRTADVLVINLPDSVLQSMHLDFEHLSAINPRLIYVSISAFGSHGPYFEKPGFDAVGQLMSGAASRTGSPEQPVKTPVQYVDWGTGMAATIGTLAALLHRGMTGRGQRVEAALLPTAMLMASAMIIEQAVARPNRKASLNRGQLSAPNDIFAVKDGWILVQVVGKPLFKRWAQLVERPEWVDDPRFANDKLRGENWEVINQHMSEWCAARTKKQALEQLAKVRVPGYPLYTVQEAIEDPHVKATGLLQDVDYPGLPRPAPIVKTPINLTEMPLAPAGRAPLLGEHTESILSSLDYTPQEIASLRQSRII